MAPVSLDTLNAADRKAFAAVLGEVMELAPWVADDAFAARPFAGVAALYAAMTDAVKMPATNASVRSSPAIPISPVRRHARVS